MHDPKNGMTTLKDGDPTCHDMELLLCKLSSLKNMNMNVTTHQEILE